MSIEHSRRFDPSAVTFITKPRQFEYARTTPLLAIADLGQVNDRWPLRRGEGKEDLDDNGIAGLP
jgi:hypothetical protein